MAPRWKGGRRIDDESGLEIHGEDARRDPRTGLMVGPKGYDGWHPQERPAVLDLDDPKPIRNARPQAAFDNPNLDNFEDWPAGTDVPPRLWRMVHGDVARTSSNVTDGSYAADLDGRMYRGFQFTSLTTFKIDINAINGSAARVYIGGSLVLDLAATGTDLSVDVSSRSGVQTVTLEGAGGSAVFDNIRVT